MSYPAGFPVAELTNILGILKAGTVKENVKEFAHDLWWCQGFAQSLIIGAPVLVLSQEMRHLTLDETVTQLEKLLNQQGADDASAQALNPLFYMLLKFAIEELIAVFKDYLGEE